MKSHDEEQSDGTEVSVRLATISTPQSTEDRSEKCQQYHVNSNRARRGYPQTKQNTEIGVEDAQS